jgi:hypothetical protein
VKAATRAETVTVRLSLSDPDWFLTVNVTVLDPTVVNTWVGFWAVEEVSSPKLHCQDVGLPVDASMKRTAWPKAGEPGA